MINTLSGGGAEKVLLDLLNQLDPEMYDLELVTITGGVHEKEIPEYVNYRRIINVKNRRLGKFLSKIIYKLPGSLFASLYLGGVRDIEIAYLEGLPTRFVAAKKDAVSKIAFVHCDLSVNNIISPFYKDDAETKREYETFDRVCFVSDNSKKGFETVFGPLEKSCVVHNVVDYDKIIERSFDVVPEHFETDGVKIVTVGRLVKEKAFDRLIRIAAELEKKYGFELWIIGEGSERETLEDLIAEKNVSSVRLMGYRDNPYPLIKQADLFVCSSLTEGYSTAVTEAVVLDLPVLTTKCAGMEEILKNGKYGIIVDNSEECLKSSLEQIVKEPTIIVPFKNNIQDDKKHSRKQGPINEYVNIFDLVSHRS